MPMSVVTSKRKANIKKQANSAFTVGLIAADRQTIISSCNSQISFDAAHCSVLPVQHCHRPP